jgi:hypothetical protein
MEIAPAPNNRVDVFGPTRCGKSRFMRWLFYRYARNGIIVDFKGDWPKAPQDIEAKDLRSLDKALDKAMSQKVQYASVSFKTHPHVLYRVPKEHQNPENSAKLDLVAKWALERKNTTLYYDELVFVANGSDFWKRAPNYYYAITTGAGQGVGVWGCAQRPAWIPKIALTETDLRGSFYLRSPDDQKTAADLIGPIDWDVLSSHKYSLVLGTDFDTSLPFSMNFADGKPTQIETKQQAA